MLDRKRFFLFLIFDAFFWFAAAALFHAWQYSGGIIICIVFVIWFLLQKTIEERFVVLLSGLPFQAITKISSGLPSVAVVLYLLFVIFYLREQGFVAKRRNVLSLLVLVFLNLIGLLCYQASLSKMFSGFLMVIFSTCAIGMFSRTENPINLFEQAFWTLVVSAFIDIYSVSVFPRLPYLIELRKQQMLDRLGRFCALNGDPNYYGQLLLVVIGFLITMCILRARKRKYRSSLLCAVGAVLLSVNGMRAISKGFVIGLTFLLVMTIWFLMMENRPAHQKVYWFFAFLVLGLGVSIVLGRDVVMPLFAKRTEADLFTGRLDIWRSYLKLFSDRPEIIFWGSGFFNTHPFMKVSMGVTKAAHNLFIEVLGDMGLIGIIAVGFLWSGAVSKWKMLTKSVTSLFFWGFLLTSLTLSASANDLIFFVVPLFSALMSSSEYLEYMNRRGAENEAERLEIGWEK